MATDKQIQLIHVLKNKAGFDDETYLQMLEEFGVQSSKNLTSAQAAKLIDRLSQEKRHLRRNGFVTDKQVFVIAKKWRDLSKMQDAEEKDKALKSYIQKKFGKTQIYDLTRKEAAELIRAFLNWGGKK